VAYLENSADSRNTPALPLIQMLLDRGADVVAHDPYVRQHDWHMAWGREPPVALHRDLNGALAGADCAAFVTCHKIYAWLGLDDAGQARQAGLAQRMRTLVLVDGRSILQPEFCRRAGFVYRGLGKAH